MNARHNYKTHAVLRRLAGEIESMIEDRRARAGFHALEAIEASSQDTTDEREQALRLSAEASGCVAVLELIRGEMGARV